MEKKLDLLTKSMIKTRGFPSMKDLVEHRTEFEHGAVWLESQFSTLTNSHLLKGEFKPV